MGCFAVAHIILLLERPQGSTGRTASSFFLIKNEPFALTEAVQFKPFVFAGDGQGMCFDWLALDWQWKVNLDQAENARIGTATVSRGPKMKSFVRLIFASTMRKGLLCMLSGKRGQAKRCPSS